MRDIFMSLMISTLVSACGGATTPNLAGLETRINSARAQADRINALSGTAFRAMPTHGAATFVGSAGLVIDPVEATDRDDIVVVGDARLTADFQNGAMTGRITNMVAATDITAAGAVVSTVNGAIEIGANTSVIGDDFDDNLTNRANQWYADYGGTITVQGVNYAVEGNIDGEFKGTRTKPAAGLSAVKAVVGVDSDGFAVVNGRREEVAVTLEIGGENK